MPQQPSALKQEANLIAVRNAALVFLCCLTAGWLFLQIPTMWKDLDFSAQLLVVAAVAAFVGAILSWRRQGIWVASGVLVLLTAAGLHPANGQQWLPLAVIAAPLTYVIAAAGMSLWTAIGSTAIPAVMIGLAKVKNSGYIVGPLSVGQGIPFAALVAVAGLATHWAWRSSMSEARDADKETARMLEREALLRSATQRRVVWEETSLQLHETILNTNRYLLDHADAATHGLNEHLQSYGDAHFEFNDRSFREQEVLPIPPAQSPDEVFSRGRLLIIAPLAGQLLMNPIFIWAAHTWEASRWATFGSAITSTTGLATSWLIARRKPLRILTSLVLAAGFLAYPLTALNHGLTCTSISAQVVALSLCGYGVLVIASMCDLTLSFVLIPSLLATLWTLIESSETTCRSEFSIVLLRVAMLIVPLIYGTYLASRSMSRAAQRGVEAFLLLQESDASLSAAQERTEALRSIVDETHALYREGAAGAFLTTTAKHRLACLDAQLRATLQVGRGPGGAMARLALLAVLTASDSNTIVEVGNLGGSSDARPISQEVVDLCIQLMGPRAAHRIGVTSFTDGSNDYLAINHPFGDQIVASWRGLCLELPERVQVEHDGVRESYVVLISRPLQAIDN